MGLSFTVYVGPYLRAVNPVVPTNVEIRSCANPECKKHGQQRYDESKIYCESCGNAIAKVTVVKQLPRMREDLTEEVEQRIYEYDSENSSRRGVDLWVRNHDCGAGRTFDRDDAGEELEINPELIQMELSKFSRFFASEIEVLNKHYGAENVELRWGVLTCYR